MSIVTIKQTNQYFLEKQNKQSNPCFSLYDYWESQMKRIRKKNATKIFMIIIIIKSETKSNNQN
jgi:hypothetical protein